MEKASSMLALFCLAVLFVFVNHPAALAGSDSRLARKVQKELDNNPFLAKARIKLRVIDEQNGYLTIEMYEGNKELRKLVSEGYDIFSIQIDQQWLWAGNAKDRERESLSVLRTVSRYIKTLPGVKEIVVTAVLKANSDRAKELFAQAETLNKAGKYSEAAVVLQETLKLYENPDAQFLLGFYYFIGRGVKADREAGIELLEQAAGENQPGALTWLPEAYIQSKKFQEAIAWYEERVKAGNTREQGALAELYATCEEPAFRNGEKALKYAQGAYDQYPNNWPTVDILAAAYARVGDFKKAAETERRYIKIVREDKGLPKPVKYRFITEGLNKLKLYEQNQAYSKEMNINQPVSRLKITSEPSGCQVVIDKNPVGSTPLELPLRLGEHDVTLKKEGYYDWDMTVEMDGTGELVELPKWQLIKKGS